MNNPRKPKDITTGLEARTKLLEGAWIFAKTVTRTMGPKSGTVMLDRVSGILSTKDGVTVAREIHLADPLQNLGCAILREACIKVNNEAGDGTTTAACLAAGIVREAHKIIVGGSDPMQIVKGIREAAAFATETLWDIATPVEDREVLKCIALNASNHDEEVAETLTEACLAVGKNGTVVIEEGQSVGLEIEMKEGMEIDRGSASPYFLNNGAERLIEGSLVAVIPKVLVSIKDIQSVMEESSQWPDNDLVVIAKGIEGEALQTMVVNHKNGNIRCLGIKAPGFGHHVDGMMEDIAALAGCDVVDENKGFNHQKFEPEWFGSFRQVQVQGESAVFMAFDEAKDSVQIRIDHLKNELEGCPHEYDQDKLQERIAKLQGGFCSIKAGGATEPEIRERRARIEDALGAVQAALRDGTLPGGGAALLAAKEDLEARGFQEGSFGHGQRILANALTYPMRVIAQNAGESGDIIIHPVTEARSNEEDPDVAAWIGWDANTGEIRDLGKGSMVIDPALVTTKALEAAVSVAGSLLSVETAISLK